MKKLILLELKLMLPKFAMIYVFVLILTFITGDSMILAIFPAIAVALSTNFARRSNWYLSLPFSRRQIMATIFVQNCIVMLANYSVSIGLIFVLHHIGLLNTSQNFFDLKVMGVFGIMGFLFSSTLAVFAGRPIQRVPLFNKKPRLHDLLRLLTATVIVSSFFWLRIYEESIFYWISLVALPFALIYIFCWQIVLPIENMQRLARLTKFSLSILIFIPVIVALFLAQMGSPQMLMTELAVRFLGRLPIFLSDSRAVDLFRHSTIGRAPAMVSHLAAISSDFDEQAWQERTRKCLDGGCLNLSSDVLKSSQLAQVQAANYFLTLLEPCKLQLQETGAVRCQGPRLSGARLNAWLDTLNKEGIIDQWLLGEQSLAQIVALKSLPPTTLTLEQVKRVTELSLAKDPRVAITARRLLSDGQALAALNLKCETDVDLAKPGCHARRIGPQAEF